MGRYDNSDDDSRNPASGGRGKRKLGLGFFLIVLIAAGAASGIGIGVFGQTFSAGVSQVGFKVNSWTGEYSAPQTGPFTHYFDHPAWVNVITISTAVQSIDMWSKPAGAPYPDVSVLSADNLEVGIELTVRYQVNPNHAIDLFKKYPTLSYGDAIVSIIRSDVRTEVAKYSADQLQVVRQTIQDDLQVTLTTHFKTDPSLANAIDLVGFNIRGINLPQAFLDAITAKLAAQQALIQATFDAQKIVLLATAAANATIAKAIGTAQATVIASQATASAITAIAVAEHLNATQTAQLTMLYVYLQALQQISASGGTVVAVTGTTKGQFIMLRP